MDPKCTSPTKLSPEIEYSLITWMTVDEVLDVKISVQFISVPLRLVVTGLSDNLDISGKIF